jgi:hypothetical protein
MFARLGGERAAPARQKGVALILAAVADLADEEATYEDIRMRMADRADAWSNANDRPIAADEWRAVQIRQLFRLALEGLFYWTIGALLPASRSTRQLAQAFIDALDETSLADSAGEWILASKDTTNPVEHLRSLQKVLRDQERLPTAIVAALALCLREAPNQGHPFENPDRLPLSRARRRRKAGVSSRRPVSSGACSRSGSWRSMPIGPSDGAWPTLEIGARRSSVCGLSWTRADGR